VSGRAEKGQAARSNAPGASTGAAGTAARRARSEAAAIFRRTSTASAAPIATPTRVPTAVGIPAVASAHAPTFHPTIAQRAKTTNGFMRRTVPRSRARVDPLLVPGELAEALMEREVVAALGRAPASGRQTGQLVAAAVASAAAAMSAASSYMRR